MNTVIGYEKEKKELAVIRDMLKNADYYRENGVRIPRGLLLSGKPGVGKTVLAKSVAGDGINLVELKAVSCCDDEAADCVVDSFAKAKELSPAVLLLDELDKIAGYSAKFFVDGNDKVNKTLLQELDALTPEDNVLVVATCNDDAMLSDELIRPGRFDRQMDIPVPDAQTRSLILESYFEKIKVRKDFDIEKLVKNTSGFTGATLECLANESGISALTDGRDSISEDDVRLAINKLEFGAAEKDPFDDFESLHRVSVHEAGHAFTALYLCPDSICGASVMPQGDSNGHIRFVPDEKSVKTVSDVEKEIEVLIAGHVAERVILGEYLMGSDSDIEKAALRLSHLCTKEAAYGYETVILGLYRGMHDVSGELPKMQFAKLVEDRLFAADAKVEQLIFDHPRVYSAICHALEDKRVLTKEELVEIKEKAASEEAA